MDILYRSFQPVIRIISYLLASICFQNMEDIYIDTSKVKEIKLISETFTGHDYFHKYMVPSPTVRAKLDCM
jgi:hypothetical protein